MPSDSKKAKLVASFLDRTWLPVEEVKGVEMIDRKVVLNDNNVDIGTLTRSKQTQPSPTELQKQLKFWVSRLALHESKENGNIIDKLNTMPLEVVLIIFEYFITFSFDWVTTPNGSYTDVLGILPFSREKYACIDKKTWKVYFVPKNEHGRKSILLKLVQSLLPSKQKSEVVHIYGHPKKRDPIYAIHPPVETTYTHIDADEKFRIPHPACFKLGCIVQCSGCERKVNAHKLVCNVYSKRPDHYGDAGFIINYTSCMYCQALQMKSIMQMLQYQFDNQGGCGINNFTNELALDTAFDDENKLQVYVVSNGKDVLPLSGVVKHEDYY